MSAPPASAAVAAIAAATVEKERKMECVKVKVFSMQRAVLDRYARPAFDDGAERTRMVTTAPRRISYLSTKRRRAAPGIALALPMDQGGDRCRRMAAVDSAQHAFTSSAGIVWRACEMAAGIRAARAS